MKELLLDPYVSYCFSIVSGFLLSYYFYKKGIKDGNKSSLLLNQTINELKVENEKLHMTQIANSHLQDKKIGSISEYLEIDNEIKTTPLNKLIEKIKNLLKEGRKEEALKYLYRIEDVRPSKDYHKALCLMLLFNKDFVDAANISEKLIEKNPSSLEFRILNISSLLGNKNFEKAKLAIDELLPQNEKEERLYSLLAEYYLHKNDFTNSLSVIKYSLNLNLFDPISNQIAGRIYLLNGDDFNAIKHFEIAKENGASNPDLFKAFSSALNRIKEYEKSLNLLNEAIAIYPNDKNFILRKIIIIYFKTDYLKAHELFKSNIEIVKQDIYYINYYLDCCNKVAFFNEVINFSKLNLIDKIVKYDSVIISGQGEKMLLNALKAAYSTHLGEAYYGINDFINAELQLNRALEFDETYSRAYSDLGLIYFQNNTTINFEKSIYYCNQALSYNPNELTALNTLGCINLQLKNIDKAIAYLEKAVLVEPTFKLAQENLTLARRFKP